MFTKGQHSDLYYQQVGASLAGDDSQVAAVGGGHPASLCPDLKTMICVKSITFITKSAIKIGLF